MSRLLTFEVQGQRATLRVDSLTLFPMAERFHSCARVSTEPCDESTPADLVWKSGAGRQHDIELFGKLWDEGADGDTVFFQSENLLTQIFSLRHADKLQLHAGAVVSPGGKGWLIAGASGAGKTSLTLALMLEGWKWLSDELILVGETMPDEIVGVPRNFNIKEISFEHFPETDAGPRMVEIPSPKRQCLVRFIDPEMLLPGMFLPRANLGAILFPQFTPNLCMPELLPCRGAELSGRMVSSIFVGQPWAMEWIIGTTGKIPAWEFRYSDPRLAARFLRASPAVQSHIPIDSAADIRHSDSDNFQRMQSQSEFNFQTGAEETGYSRWVVARREAVDVVAERMNLPLGHEVEVWLRGGFRLRGTLRLLHEVLFVEEDRIQNLALVVDGVSFTYSEMESCIRLD